MGLPLAKVSTLIDHVHHVWKENLLDQYFFEFEATVIKNKIKKKKKPSLGIYPRGCAYMALEPKW